VLWERTLLDRLHVKYSLDQMPVYLLETGRTRAPRALLFVGNELLHARKKRKIQKCE
jgi:hypothetical protein